MKARKGINSFPSILAGSGVISQEGISSSGGGDIPPPVLTLIANYPLIESPFDTVAGRTAFTNRIGQQVGIAKTSVANQLFDDGIWDNTVIWDNNAIFNTNTTGDLSVLAVGPSVPFISYKGFDNRDEDTTLHGLANNAIVNNGGSWSRVSGPADAIGSGLVGMTGSLLPVSPSYPYGATELISDTSTGEHEVQFTELEGASQYYQTPNGVFYILAQLVLEPVAGQRYFRFTSDFGPEAIFYDWDTDTFLLPDGTPLTPANSGSTSFDSWESIQLSNGRRFFRFSIIISGSERSIVSVISRLINWVSISASST